MKILKIRKARKELKERLHHAKHMRHLHEDIADPELIAKLRTAEELARAARKSGEIELIQAAGQALENACRQVAPPRRHPGVREWVEILFVAIAAAAAIRAYIFQPFKIPTGSMQPTLYGITLRAQEPGESDGPISRLVKVVSKGEFFLQADSPIDKTFKRLFLGPGYTIQARDSGIIGASLGEGGIRLKNRFRDNFVRGTITVLLGNTPHEIPKQLVKYCRFNEPIRAGESILRGVAKAGDYILVNRVKYNFMRPKRGDIVVFDARDVTRDAYYVKRLVGLPNESISVDPPYLLVNGQKPTDARFDKLFTNDDYLGYVFADPRAKGVRIAAPGDSIELGRDEYLFFGDNTHNSMDGRYFGAVEEKRLLGSAFFVGLPFDRAGFAETIH